MATAKRAKVALEVLLVKAELKGIPEKGLLRSRNMIQADIVWPRSSIARKSAMREAVFRKGVCDFTSEPWTKRVVFREEVEGHCGFAVSVTEPVSVQKLRRFLRLTAKYALKMGADFMEKAMVGYADIASSPIDALAAMVGEKDAPKIVAQGVLDLPDVPGAGEEREITVPLARPLTGKEIGALTVAVRG
ncbi:MAG: hypothetical protein IJ658_02980 [Kiritimatiellae bacterium]|nr:hypothetical protein [Kiritimatiellia bacterium]